jgi:hypothetical protein
MIYDVFFFLIINFLSIKYFSKMVAVKMYLHLYTSTMTYEHTFKPIVTLTLLLFCVMRRSNVGIIRRFGIFFDPILMPGITRILKVTLHHYCVIKPEDGIEKYFETSHHSYSIAWRYKPKHLHHFHYGESLTHLLTYRMVQSFLIS